MLNQNHFGLLRERRRLSEEKNCDIFHNLPNNPATSHQDTQYTAAVEAGLVRRVRTSGVPDFDTDRPTASLLGGPVRGVTPPPFIKVKNNIV